MNTIFIEWPNETKYISIRIFVLSKINLIIIVKFHTRQKKYIYYKWKQRPVSFKRKTSYK